MKGTELQADEIRTIIQRKEQQTWIFFGANEESPERCRCSSVNRIPASADLFSENTIFLNQIFDDVVMYKNSIVLGSETDSALLHGSLPGCKRV